MTRIYFTLDPSLSDEELAAQLLSLRDSTPVIKSTDVSVPIQIVKSATKRRKNIVFGWASVPFTKVGTQLEDLQGHLIDIEDLEDAAYHFVVKYHASGDMHAKDQRYPAGELVESMIFTPDKKAELGITDAIPDGAWWVGFRVHPDVYDMVQSGRRTMFSIEGSARLEAA